MRSRYRSSHSGTGRTLTIADGETVAKRLGLPYKVTPFFIELNTEGIGAFCSQTVGF